MIVQKLAQTKQRNWVGFPLSGYDDDMILTGAKGRACEL